MNINFCTYIEKKQRVDIYLSALLNDFSRSYIQKMIDNWQVKVNNNIIKKNIKIDFKDELNIDVFTKKLEIEKENIPLDIVYEDQNLAIINKDAWINSHPTPWEDWKSWTLVNALLYHIKDLSWIGWVERPGIVHRLDKDTSGLIMIAKNDKMMLYLQDLIKKREKIWKYYLAIVNWVIKENNFIVESYIWRDPNNRIKMTTRNWINPKIAISKVKLIKIIDEKYSLVEVKIETWRTHQIRVHLSSIWYPIIWDKVYWNQKVNKEVLSKYWLNRQALHSYKLEIEIYEKNHLFYAKLKDDFKKIIWDIDLKTL